MKYIIILIFLYSSFLQAEETIAFGIIKKDTPLSSVITQNKLLSYLEIAADTTFTRVPLDSEEEIVEAFAAGTIDLAWISTHDYMKLRDRLYAYPIVKPVRFGRSYFRSAFITRTDSDIHSLDSLNGKTIAFVRRESPAGYIYPTLILKRNGMINNNHYFVQFLNGHDSVLFEIFRGKYEAGAVFDSAISVYLNAEQQKQIRVISYSNNIPYEPIIVSRRLSAEKAERIQELLLQCDNEQLLDTLKIERFTEATAQEYTLFHPRDFEILDE